MKKCIGPLQTLPLQGGLKWPVERAGLLGLGTDQLKVKADELQARHQREEQRQVVVAADQCVPGRGRGQTSASGREGGHAVIRDKQILQIEF